MQTIKQKINGLKIETHHKNLKGDNDFQYVVYKDKIWNVVAKCGAGLNRTYTLERNLAKERMSINSIEILKLQYILKPTGFISV